MHEVLIGQQGLSNVHDLPMGIKVESDKEAILAWLSEYEYQANTYQKYRTELKKFIAYLSIQELCLKDLSKEVCSQYIHWLKNPPKGLIDKTRKNKQALFMGPLSFESLKSHLRVIHSLMNYMVDSGYLIRNPFKLVKQYAKFDDREERVFRVKAKLLEPFEFEHLLKTLQSLPEITDSDRQEKGRLTLIIAMLYHLGLRVSELSDSRWSNFRENQGQLFFYLRGKGGKLAEIPVNDELLSILKQYRYNQGLSLEVAHFEDEPVLTSTKTKVGLSARRIRGLVKELFVLAANTIDNPKSKEKLLAASPHDFRHYLASHLDGLGLSILETKNILRHSSEKTTEIYRHANQSRLVEQVNQNRVGLMLTASQTLNEVCFEVLAEKDKIGNFKRFLELVELLVGKYLEGDIDKESLIQKYQKASVLRDSIKVDWVLKSNPEEDTKLKVQRVLEQQAKVRDMQIAV